MLNLRAPETAGIMFTLITTFKHLGAEQRVGLNHAGLGQTAACENELLYTAINFLFGHSNYNEVRSRNL
jgi:hypothetical protein